MSAGEFLACPRKCYNSRLLRPGYSLPDSGVQHIVDESIYSYKSHGADAFDTINDQELNRLSMCPMVGNETHITANGGNPDKAGTPYESLAAAMPAQKHGTAGS